MAPRSSGEAHLAAGSVSDDFPETREIASSKTPRDDDGAMTTARKFGRVMASAVQKWVSAPTAG